MRLVGASRWMTELPFMLEAVIAAAVGGADRDRVHLRSASTSCSTSVLGVADREGRASRTSAANDILVAGGVGLIVGVVLAALTAFATLRLYVRL